MKTKTEKLAAIFEKFCAKKHNDNNYAIGGGLDDCKFASRRHEDAKNDSGKKTIGEATQLFKKATDMDTDSVREVIEYAVPNMEWHHAGKLPKAYGGGMKKTYFLNATEICLLAKEWDSFVDKLSLCKAAKKTAAEVEKNLEARKLDFLNANAKRVTRASVRPALFHMTDREMNGKYGWFDSTYKSYNLAEYFSGWEFETQEKYNEFLNLK